MFDYEKFENDIVAQMTNILSEWTEDDDIYILALDCTREMDSIGAIANTEMNLSEQADNEDEEYWYYKYCEEEWDLFDAFEKVSSYMYQYVEDNSERFTEPKTFKYTKAFDEHCDKIIERCIMALVRLRDSIKETYPNLLLTLNVREYLDGDERVEIFEQINGKAAAEEYSAHIEDFA